MPTVSPLRMLINKQRNSEGCQDVSPYPSPGFGDEDKFLSSGKARRSLKMKAMAVYPHSENVPENVTPDRRPKAKFSWYQRQVKQLSSDQAGDSQNTPRAVVSRIDREPLRSCTDTVNMPSAYTTPKKSISRSLKYNVEEQHAPQHFELEEDSSFWHEHNVQVLIRTRPLSSSEMANYGYDRCIRQDSAHSLTWFGTHETNFTFDHVACETISQENLFKVAGLPVVENCMLGYNSCIFAYGQTGSGKTHTMIGDIHRACSEKRGMSCRVFEHLFMRIQMEEQMRKHENLKYTCRCSFLEIYKEQITDLIEPSATNLQIREDAKRGVYVENLTEVEVHCIEDVTKLLLLGAVNRKMAATNMNRESSRSHSVLTCVIESQWQHDNVTRKRFGRLNLVDLAGSERQKSSGAENERLKEAVNINRSLSTLGLVIMSLVDNTNGKPRHVPYRDSKLTFLLQDSLGGNSKTMIIATVSPSSSCSMDTLSTLKFAQRAKFIRNNAVVNEDSSGNVLALRSQIQELKEEVNRLRTQNSQRSDSVVDEDFAESPRIHKLQDDIESQASKHLEEESCSTDPQSAEISRFAKQNLHLLQRCQDFYGREQELMSEEMKLLRSENDRMQRELEECQIENKKLRLQSKEASQKTISKFNSLKLEQEENTETISSLKNTLQKREEERVGDERKLKAQLEEALNNIRQLQLQLKSSEELIEQMENQHVYLIKEFEIVLEEHNKACEREEKMKQTLEEWRSMCKGEEAIEKQMDATRREVEAETADAITCMQLELSAARQKLQALTCENSTLTSTLKEKHLEIEELRQRWDDSATKMIDFLAEGDEALTAAGSEIQEMLSEHDSSDVSVERKFIEALEIARDAEGRLKELCKSSTTGEKGEEEVEECEWKIEKEKLLLELSVKKREVAELVDKFEETQIMLTEAEQLMNALVKANEGAKDEIRKQAAVHEETIAEVAEEVGSILQSTEEEVETSMEGVEGMLREYSCAVKSFGSEVKSEMRRKEELVFGLEFDISLLQESYSEAREKENEMIEEKKRIERELRRVGCELVVALEKNEETKALMSSRDEVHRNTIQQLQLNIAYLQHELKVKQNTIESLDFELVEMKENIPDSPIEYSVNRERLAFELQECQLAAAKAQQFAEMSKAEVAEKEEEVRVLERSVQELESTVVTLETQIGLVRREAEMQRYSKEDLEIELEGLRHEMSMAKMTDDSTGGCVDKIKLLRMEEEMKSLQEECSVKVDTINTYKSHIEELMEAIEQQNKRINASGKGYSKGSSPFKCIGMGESSKKERIEELEELVLGREKEVTLLKSRLCEAESMTKDILKHLLGIKFDITSFATMKWKHEIQF